MAGGLPALNADKFSAIFEAIVWNSGPQSEPSVSPGVTQRYFCGYLEISHGACEIAKNIIT
jgi:hypothetical protein